MSDGFLYKIFYFSLFFYAITSCVRTCFHETEEETSSEGQTRENGGNNNNNENNEIDDSAERRREMVLGLLEYRKIVPPAKELTEQKGNDNEKKTKKEETDEVDLEKGEGNGNKNKNKKKNKKKKKKEKKNKNKNKEEDTDSDDDEISSKDSMINGVQSVLTSSMNIFNLMGVGASSRNQECCSICLEPYAVGDTVVRLKRKTLTGNNSNEDESKKSDTCNHWFHEDCLLQWLQNHDDCPLCRQDMVHS